MLETIPKPKTDQYPYPNKTWPSSGLIQRENGKDLHQHNCSACDNAFLCEMKECEAADALCETCEIGPKGTKREPDQSK
jgi:hypothetical protein